MAIRFVCKSFDELSTRELYDALMLRSEVFVVEQKCIFQDIDNKDSQALHILGYDDSNPTKLVAYARIFDAGCNYDLPSISRVVSSPSYRSKGAGRELVQAAINYCLEMFGDHPIKIGAQYYLKKFYEGFGFEALGEPYDEDGILHTVMIRP